MTYDVFTAAAERKQAKLERREKNKLEWAEKTKLAKAKKPIGVSDKDDKTRQQEFKEMLLKVSNGERIINKIISISLDDEHPAQGVCLKMCADRLIPVSMFEDKKDLLRTAVNVIHIDNMLLQRAGSILDSVTTTEIVDVPEEPPIDEDSEE